MKKSTFFAFFLFIFLIPYALADKYGANINQDFHYYSGSSLDNTTFGDVSDFSNISVQKSFSSGKAGIEPRTLIFEGKTFLAIPTSDNFLKIYDNTYNLITNVNVPQMSGQMAVWFDNRIISVGTAGELNVYEFNGTALTTVFSGITDSKTYGFSCDGYYCAATGAASNINQSHLYRLFYNASGDVQLDTYNFSSTAGSEECNTIPIIKDIDGDGNTEAVFVTMSDASATAGGGVGVFDLNNGVVKDSFGTDGFVGDFIGDCSNPAIINPYGSDESGANYIVATDGDVIIYLWNIYGIEKWHYHITGTGNSINRVQALIGNDFDNDEKSDIAAIIYYTGEILRFYKLDGITGELLGITQIATDQAKDVTDSEIFIANFYDISNPTNILRDYYMVTLDGLYDISSTSSSTETAFWNINSSDYYNIIFEDVNNDGYGELIFSKADNTTIYYSGQANAMPVISDVYYTTASPICFNAINNFVVTWSDAENDIASLGVDCYGNGSVVWEGASIKNPASTLCQYNNAADLNQNYAVTVYVTDTAHLGSVQEYYYVGNFLILPQNSTLCHQEGDANINQNNATAGTAGTISGFTDSFFMGDEQSRWIMSIAIIISITIFSFAATIKIGGDGLISGVVAIFCGNLVLIFCCVFGYLPAWVAILEIILIAVVVAFFINKLYSGNSTGV
jgi:hypothetical protein